jgi:hypothetical protein
VGWGHGLSSRAPSYKCKVLISNPSTTKGDDHDDSDSGSGNNSNKLLMILEESQSEWILMSGVFRVMWKAV